MGGAAGHMAHPFDLGWVDNGSNPRGFDESRRFENGCAWYIFLYPNRRSKFKVI